MRIALEVEYDGTDYFGWQRQSEGRTVQSCVETALSEVADHPVGVVCAGRTDTGVHATGQIVHFDTAAERPMDGWMVPLAGCRTLRPPALFKFPFRKFV